VFFFFFSTRKFFNPKSMDDNTMTMRQK